MERIGQPGLAKRMGQEARRISSQHRQLDDLFALVTGAIRCDAATEACRCFGRFCDALEAHFSLEDGFYFPAVHGMRPELAEELSALSRDHAVFREQMQQIAQALETGELARCNGQLDVFADLLARHEEREERLLARIRGEGEAGSPDGEAS